MKLDENIKNYTGQLVHAQNALKQDSDRLKQLAASGIKPTRQGRINSMTDDSMNTSRLGGASGGLGEAKIINIHFHDALQKVIVTDGKGIRKAAEAGVGVLLRTLNNVALSQSTTQ